MNTRSAIRCDCAAAQAALAPDCLPAGLTSESPRPEGVFSRTLPALGPTLRLKEPQDSRAHMRRLLPPLPPPPTTDFSVGDSSRDPSGRAVDYLHSIHARRLKKHIEPPSPKEKAGTLTSSRFFGPPVPLRGKGQARPPAFGEGAAASYGVKRVPGKGHVLSANVLHPAASAGTQPVHRPAVRLYEHTFDSAFKGAAIIVDRPVRAPKIWAYSCRCMLSGRWRAGRRPRGGRRREVGAAALACLALCTWQTPPHAALPTSRRSPPTAPSAASPPPRHPPTWR